MVHCLVPFFLGGVLFKKIMIQVEMVKKYLFKFQGMYKIDFSYFSEGGTEEDRRIDPPLNFGIFIENNNKIWKKWLRSSPRLIKKIPILP